MKPRYAVRKTMLVIATFACLLAGAWVFHATQPKATPQKAQPMVLVYDMTKSAGTTITLPIIGRIGQPIGKANVTRSNDGTLLTLPNHGLKNGQEIWFSGTNDTYTTTKPYRVTNAQKNTFALIEMWTGEGGIIGFEPGREFNEYVEGTVHKGVLPDVTIQWGDGKTTRMTASGLVKHTYAKTGKYTVTITGRLPKLGWGVVEDDGCQKANERKFSGIEKLVAVQSFGTLDTYSLSGAFAGAGFLTEVPDVLPPTVTDISFLFNGAKTFNDNIVRWNTSNVTNMSAMFCEAIAFNQPLEQWNVSNVTDMSGMFGRALAFNQPLEKWNVSNVTNMRQMFALAAIFNQPLEKWNVSQVTNMEGMFAYARFFNQPLEKWNVSNVTNMEGMYAYAKFFNQPLAQWNVSKVTNMSGMFYGAKSFNQPLEKWNVLQVTNMSWVFNSATAFNQPLAQWNVSQVTKMNEMFNGATSFDQDLSRWCVREIKTEPENFSTDASNWKKAKPPWGMCP